MNNDDLKEFANIIFAPSERNVYKRRIDKAIEYIDKLIPSKDINYPLDYYLEIEIGELFELINILKGSNKE